MYKNRKMIQAIMIIGVLILLAPAFVMAQQNTQTMRVNCNRGQSVQSALNRSNGPATIVVTGTCHENIVITQDDVTLQGGSYAPTDSTQSTILVNGARRVSMISVTVTGGRNGISAYQGGSLTLGGTPASNSSISGTSLNGVVASYGSSVTVNYSTIQANVNGVTATDNSALVLTNSTIMGNTGTGVLVLRSSNARIGQNILGVQAGNTITNNGASGVYISRSSNALIDGNTIEHNTDSGVGIEGSSATVINNNIKYNGFAGILVFSSGNARIGITDSDGYGKNWIENNTYDGIHIASASTAHLMKNEIRNNGQGTGRNGIGIYFANCELIGGNIIENNSGYGIVLSQGSLFQGIGDWVITPAPGRDEIRGNTLTGVLATMKSSAELRNALINGNTQHGIWISTQSTLRIYGSTVSNNTEGIRLDTGSGISFWHPTSESTVTVTNNSSWGLNCFGNESSYGGSADPPNISGNGSGGTENINPSCTGF